MNLPPAGIRDQGSGSPPFVPRRAARAALPRAAAGLLALVLVCGGARAHDFWIAPASFRPAAGRILSVRLEQGHVDAPERWARDPTRLERFELLGPDARHPVVGLPGAEPAGVVRVPGDGFHLVVLRTRPKPIRLAAIRFELYLREEGLESIVAAREAREETGKDGVEEFARCAKSIVRCGDATEGFDRVVGLPLELIPECDPTRLAAGAELPVRLLWNGKPLAGARVAAEPMLPGAKATPVSARTDAEGRVRLVLESKGDAPARWFVKAVHMVAAPDPARADWESYWASLTFETDARTADGSGAQETRAG